MARLTGALFSLAASGTIADTLTYAKWKGIQYVRTRVIPANPNTSGQQEVRGIFSTLNEMYKRMSAVCRIPWTYAVRGLALTARNRFIQANVAALQDDADLDDLVLSVSTGQAIAPTGFSFANLHDGTIQAGAVIPAAIVGYTLTHMTYYAVLDGDPSPKLTRTMLTGSKQAAPWDTIINCPTDGKYQCAAVARFTRDSDSRVFCSGELRGTVICDGN